MQPAAQDHSTTQFRRTAAVIQSCYIPWKGFFDIVGSVDVFVIYDDVQYAKRHWHNRNKIKTADGLKWLTIPVETKGKYLQNIDETRISDTWADKHMLSIRHAYRKAPHFDEIAAWFEPLYEEAAKCEMLSDVNALFMRAISEQLGFETEFVWSSDLSADGQKTDRLLNICQEIGADCYLSGPAAQVYFEGDKFDAAGVAYRWMDYSGYAEYPQLHGAFEHGVSAVDLLMNVGADARAFMKAPIDLG
ncbi:MAG: WbqC family protein [Maricaulaceae bacterium]|jgi:hypothetical protein